MSLQRQVESESDRIPSRELRLQHQDQHEDSPQLVIRQL